MLMSSQRNGNFRAAFPVPVVEGILLASAFIGDHIDATGVFEGVKTGPVAYSKEAALHHAPQPFGDLPDDVAEQQQRRRPDQRGYEIGDLKAPVRHLEYPGSERHRGPQRSEKSPDEDARYAPGFHKGFPARQYLRITRQRPDLRDLLLVPEAEPVGDPIAERSPDPTGNPDPPEADAARADQCADRDQRPPGRDQQRDKGKRFTQRQHHNDRCRPGLMVAHEVGQRARKIFHSERPSPAIAPFEPLNLSTGSMPKNR